MATEPDSTNRADAQSQNPQPRYTPNPWTYDEDDARIYYDDGNVQPTIAYVEREGVAPEQVKADGYLLAASPHLLAIAECQAALDLPHKEFYAILRKHGWDGSNLSAWMSAKARAAVAKATGGAS
jgi:hypothetical protein